MDSQESTDKQKVVNYTSIDSDANQSQKMTTVLLNGFNYLPWSRAVTIALGGRSRLGFINGKAPAPDSSSPDFEKWLAKDQMVMSWMLNSMDRNLAEMFSYYQSSFELWEAVREMYGNQNNSARIFQIQQDITSVQQNGQPFVQLLSKLKSLWNELEIYRPHSIDPKVLRNRKEEDQIFQLLASLGPEFEDLRSHILMNDELPSLKSVCATIQREEIKRKVMPRENPLKFADSHACVAHQFSDKMNFKLLMLVMANTLPRKDSSKVSVLIANALTVIQWVTPLIVAGVFTLS